MVGSRSYLIRTLDQVHDDRPRKWTVFGFQLMNYSRCLDLHPTINELDHDQCSKRGEQYQKNNIQLSAPKNGFDCKGFLRWLWGGWCVVTVSSLKDLYMVPEAKCPSRLGWKEGGNQCPRTAEGSRKWPEVPDGPSGPRFVLKGPFGSQEVIFQMAMLVLWNIFLTFSPIVGIIVGMIQSD